MAEAVGFNSLTREYQVPDEDAPGGYRLVPETAYETSGIDAALIGAGKTFTDFSRGIRDLFGSDTAAAEQAEADQLFAPLADEQTAATLVGQSLPYLATAPFAGSGVLANAAVAGGLGAARQVGDLRERAQQGALEGVFGGAGAALGNLGSRAVNQIAGRFEDTVAGQFARSGGRVTPGQATGSSGLQRAEATLESAGAFDPSKAKNQALIQGQVSKSIGQKGTPDLTNEGLGNAADDIGARMTDALEGTDVTLDDALIAQVNTAVGENPFLQLPEDFTNMTGRQYQQLRRQLTDVARAEARTASPTPGKADFVSGVIDDLDTKFIDSAGPEAAASLRVAREQWRNLITAEKGQALTSDGLVNPRTLRNNLNQTFGKAARRGKTDRLLPETRDLIKGVQAQTAKQLGPVVGDSGTAGRLGLGLGLLGLGAGGGALSGADAGTSAGLGLGALLLGRGYAGAGNALAGQVSPLITNIGRSLGQGAAQQ